jgi:predicted ATPase
MAVVEGACAIARESGVHYWDAELERLRGALAAEPGDAEAGFERAIAIARDQRAPSFELRATTSLARLWRDRRREEARTRLASVYGTVTEGFATADLRDARTLLDELGGPVTPEGRSPRARRRAE